jgi:hypothetical protein
MNCKRCSFDLIHFKYLLKRFLQNFLLASDQVPNYLLDYSQHFQEVILPPITYGNMALIALSYFHGYK